jgi:hypothetical protein
MINVEQSDRYALDGLSPIRHVVTALVRAQRALAISEFSYKHHLPGDLTRVQSHEKIVGERAANEWLVKWALTQLGPNQIEEIDGTHYNLKIPHEKVRWHYAKGRSDKVHLVEDAIKIWSGGNEPFSELSGPFWKNIRTGREKDDLTELRDSMREFGWIEHFPALVDERGTVLVGHRRLKVAEELDINPVTKRITLGKGGEADAKRLKLAIASNIGFRPLSAESRRNLASYLYNDLDWSMERIGEALRVSETQISRDLKDSKKERNPDRTDKLGRTNNTGPRRSTTAEQEAEIIDRYFNKGEKMAAIGKEMSLGVKVVQRVVWEERASRAENTSDTSEDTRQEPESEPAVPEKNDPPPSENPEPEKPVEAATTPDPAPKHECVWITKTVCKVCGEEHP